MSKAYAQISITDVTDKGIQSITELYYCSDSDAEPAKPTEHVELSADDEYNKWNLTCPAPTNTYKYYYTCSEILYTDETRGWSDVVTNSAYTAMEDDIQEAATKATGYITDIDNDGIKVHAANDTTNYAQITSDGISLCQDNVEVASFSTNGVSLYQDGDEIAHFSTEGISYNDNVSLVIGAENEDNYLKWDGTDLTVMGGDIIASKMRTEDNNSFIDLGNNQMELKNASTFEEATSALQWDGDNLNFKGMINVLPGSNVYTKGELDDALDGIDGDTTYERCQYAYGTVSEVAGEWSYDIPELTSTYSYLWFRYVVVTRDTDTGEETIVATGSANKTNIMSGVYTFMDGLKDGTTTIDGGCITTGTINASLIVIGDTGDTTLDTKLEDVDESVTSAATSASNAETSAGKVVNYITASTDGLKVHQKDHGSTNYIHISSSGLKVYTGGVQRLLAGGAGLTYYIDPDVSFYPYFNVTTSSASFAGPSPTIHATNTGGQLSLSAGFIDASCAMDVGGNLCPGTDGKYTLGSSSYKWKKIYASSSSIATSSDRRRKKNITPLDERYIEFFDKLEPIRYNDKGEDDGEIHLGFIAQDIEEALNDVGLDKKKHSIVDDGTADADENVTGAFYSLCYTEFIPVLVSKIKQLEKIIEELEGNNV